MEVPNYWRHAMVYRSAAFVAVGLAMLVLLAVLLQRVDAQVAYTLKPTPKTVAWGYYDAKGALVLRVNPGDTADIQTLITNSPKRPEEAGLPPEQVEQSLRVALRFYLSRS